MKAHIAEELVKLSLADKRELGEALIAGTDKPPRFLIESGGVFDRFANCTLFFGCSTKDVSECCAD